MSDNNTYNRDIENAQPLDETSLKEAELHYGFSYRQEIGGLIYAIVTCCPDISFPIIKLSQYSVAPTTEHFKVVHQMFNYIRKTKYKGLCYWRQTPQVDLPIGNLPQTRHTYNYDPTTQEETDPAVVQAIFDSDYSNNTQHRRSVTRISVKNPDESIFY